MRILKTAVLILIFSCCRQEKTKRTFLMERDGFRLKGYTNRDSLLVDTLFYYDSDNHLIRKEFYQNGKIEGLVFDYYSNGQVQIISSYSNGKKNGELSYFDSLGNFLYSEYYYFDLLAGPIISKSPNNGMKNYSFKNLEGVTFFSFNFNKPFNIEDLVLNSIVYKYSIQHRADSSRGSLLVYLLKPPKINYKYMLFKRRSSNNNPAEYEFIENINSNLPFKYLYFPIKKDSSQFVIGLKVYDSTHNRSAIIYKDVVE